MLMNGTIPIIRLEVEHLRYQMCGALTEHAVQMDKDLKAAVDAYCTEENLAKVVKAAATRALDEVIRDEVEKFFRYGEGREAVATAVKESILKRETYTPLDDV